MVKYYQHCIFAEYNFFTDDKPMEIYHENIQSDYSIRRMSKFSHSVSHWHQRVEILYVLEGDFLVDIGKRSYTGTPGDMYVIHSGEIHYLRPKNGTGTLYVCTFNPTLLHLLQPEIKYIQSHIPLSQLQQAGVDDEMKCILDERCRKKSPKRLGMTF